MDWWVINVIIPASISGFLTFALTSTPAGRDIALALWDGVTDIWHHVFPSRKKHQKTVEEMIEDDRRFNREMRAREMREWDNEFRHLSGMGPLYSGIIDGEIVEDTIEVKSWEGRIRDIFDQRGRRLNSSVVLPPHEEYPEVVEMELASPEDRAETLEYLKEYSVSLEERKKHREEVMELQRIARHGGYWGPIDGVPGPKMMEALNRINRA